MRTLNEQSETLIMSDSIADRLSHWSFDDQEDNLDGKCTVSDGDFSANFDIIGWHGRHNVTIEVPSDMLKVLFDLSESAASQVFGKSFAVLGTSASKEEQGWHVCLYLEDI